jgi:hypothetical protein
MHTAQKNLFFNVPALHGWHLPKSNLRAEKTRHRFDPGQAVVSRFPEIRVFERSE